MTNNIRSARGKTQIQNKKKSKEKGGSETLSMG